MRLRSPRWRLMTALIRFAFLPPLRKDIPNTSAEMTAANTRTHMIIVGISIRNNDVMVTY